MVRNAPLHVHMESTGACSLHSTTCTRDLLVRKASLLDADLWRGVIDATTRDAYFAIREDDAWEQILDDINHGQVPDLVRLAHRNGVGGLYVQCSECVDAEDRKGMLTEAMTEESQRGMLEEADNVAADLGKLLPGRES